MLPMRNLVRAGYLVGLAALCAFLTGDLTAQAPASVTLTFDRYHSFKETKALLDGLATAFPGLARVYSIGKDFKGFDVWAIEITNQRTGPAAEKPAFYADGNIDADEPSASEVTLYVAHRVLSQYGADTEITRLLDTSVLYLVPMCNPYMADLYVSTPMTGIVSSINARPRDDDDDGRFDEDPPEDLDGDGHILQMRVRDRRGAFKPHARDPRLMVRRTPEEPGEWTVYSEGLDNDGGVQRRFRRNTSSSEKREPGWNVAEKATIESAVVLTGNLKKDKRAPDGSEITVDKLEIIGLSETFPIAKDKSEEFLRDVRHLWLRSRKMQHYHKDTT